MHFPRADGLVRFGGFEFDPSSRELRKGRTRIRVPDQSAAILAMLLERPGELVTREAIQSRLWPHGTVVEFEHSVNSAIKRLRQALLDTASTPRFVETLPRKGYRFIGTLEPAEGEPAGLTPGTIISHYRILAEAGRGAMGVVYKAEDTNLGRMVALKFLPDELATHPPALERMRREARMIAALNHPGICTMYELGEASGRVFLVMEFLEGETLRTRGKFSESELIDIGVQVSKALEAAHGAGMVHRDIKPDNLFLTKQGVVKLMDFGLAKPVEEESGGAQQSTVTGTSGYMSPEQMRGENVDHRSDLFSFGLVIREMAGGARDFPGDDSHELPASVSPALAAVLRRCLEKEPDRRFQSAAELGSALQSLSLSAARAEQPKRRAWWKWAALLGAFAIAGAVYWLGVRLGRAPAPPETTLRRLTNNPDLTTNAAISPDGKLLAYVMNHHIWVQQIDSSGLIQITNDPASDNDPAFSPDGTQIAFRSEREGGGIYLAPVLGGEARMLVPQGHRPRFSPDGRWLMYLTQDTAEPSGSRLFVQPMSGDAATQIGAGCGVVGRTAVWSPDGSRILFVGGCDGNGQAAWISNLDGKDLKSNHDLHALWHLRSAPLIDQWIADPPRLLMPLGVADATYVTAVPVSSDGTRVTGPSQRLTSLTDNLTRVSAALNGRMALSVYAKTAHIWGLPIDTKGQATGEPKQLTYGAAVDGAPALSRDGEKLAFTSLRVNGRLFYKDLANGQERELSTDEHDYGSPVFNPAGTGIMCSQHPDPRDQHDLMYYVPLSGGLSRKIWDASYWSSPWDWSPDGKTLLFFTGGDPGKLRFGVVRQLDLDSQSVTTFLDDPDFDTWEAHFSHDGRWVTFHATKKFKSSRIYVVPFRKALLPRSEWIAITDGGSDEKPRFSYDDKLIFFRSNRDGSRRLWAQRLGPDMRPDGKPVAVYPLGQSKLGPVISDDEFGVGPQRIVFTQVEEISNIWLLEPVKRDTH